MRRLIAAFLASWLAASPALQGAPTTAQTAPPRASVPFAFSASQASLLRKIDGSLIAGGLRASLTGSSLAPGLALSMGADPALAAQTISLPAERIGMLSPVQEGALQDSPQPERVGALSAQAQALQRSIGGLSTAAGPLREAIAGPSSFADIHSAGMSLQDLLAGGSHIARKDLTIAALPVTEEGPPGPSLRPSPDSGASRWGAVSPPSPERTGRESPRVLFSSFFPMLAVFSLPMSLWPQILPLAALGALFATLLFLDVVSRGALTRGFSERRRAARGLRKDLDSLFAFPRGREEDHRRLREFLSRWDAASPDARLDLVGAAAQDRDLWRQKLTVAYLASSFEKGFPGSKRAALLALRDSPWRRMSPLEPVLQGIALARAQIPWLNASRPVQALSLLEELTGVPAQKPERRMPPLRAAASAALFAAAAALIALTGLSAHKTLAFHRLQEQTAQAMLSMFYDKEDLRIFSSSYDKDGRIPELVLPALKRWNHSEPGDFEALERAVEILRHSSEPQADDVLEVMLKHAVNLSLSEPAKDGLLTALVDRKDSRLWKLLPQLLAQAKDPRYKDLMLRLVRIVGQQDGEDTLQNLFYFLRSPEPALEAETLRLIRAQQADPEKFLNGLAKVQKQRAKDLESQRLIFHLLVEGLSGPRGESFIQVALLGVWDPVLDALKGAEPAGDLRALEESLLKSRKEHGGSLPDALESMAQDRVQNYVIPLIRECAQAWPGLHQRLAKTGHIYPPGQEPAYTQAELKTLLREIRDWNVNGAQATPPSNEQLKKSRQKLLRRIESVFPRLIEFQARAGMP